MTRVNVKVGKRKVHTPRAIFSLRYFLLDTGDLRLPFRGLCFSVGFCCLLNFLVSSQFKSMAQYLENTDKFFWIRKTRFPDQFLGDIRAMVNSTVAEIIAKLEVTIFFVWIFLCYLLRYRGYHMATRRYKIFLRVLNNISRVSTANEWNMFQLEKWNFVYRGYYAPDNRRVLTCLFNWWSIENSTHWKL